MAETNSRTMPVALVDKTAAPGSREMRVIIRPLRLNFWEYEGTRAQLEAEGVIPADTRWPDGTQAVYWEDGRFSWGLRRKRPEGLKGPMKLWTRGDWWVLRCDLLNGPDLAMRRILDKKRELELVIYQNSPAGIREAYARSERVRDAARDIAFQHFKTLIPCLIPPPRGRKPKAGTKGGACHG